MSKRARKAAHVMSVNEQNSSIFLRIIGLNVLSHKRSFFSDQDSRKYNHPQKENL